VPPDPFTEIETTAGITRAAKAAIESGARSTEFDVCTKLAPIFEALPLPIAAPIPPAINAITTATTKKNRVTSAINYSNSLGFCTSLPPWCI